MVATTCSVSPLAVSRLTGITPAQSKARLNGGLKRASLPRTVIWIPNPKIARKPYHPSILKYGGNNRHCFWQIRTSPSIVQPCAKKFLNSARLKAVPR